MKEEKVTYHKAGDLRQHFDLQEAEEIHNNVTSWVSIKIYHNFCLNFKRFNKRK